jgi:hypothetical protein
MMPNCRQRLAQAFQPVPAQTKACGFKKMICRRGLATCYQVGPWTWLQKRWLIFQGDN